MSPPAPAIRNHTRIRARALAIALAQEIRRLVAAEAAAQQAARRPDSRTSDLRHRGQPVSASLRLPLQRADAPSRRRIRNMLVQLREALNFGLDFDFVPDRDLSLQRAHARNLAAVVRHSAEAGLSAGAGSVVASKHLLQGARFAEELVGAVNLIQRRALEYEGATLGEPWSATWAGTVLWIMAKLLPPDHQQQFIEEQCANLEWAESRREWFGYLLGLLVQMPLIAAAAGRR
jgi:hypothetical protein